MNAEQSRLEQDRERESYWRRWGPYLSERQWGTVREDYSATGEAWDYFPHDHARSRAYRWGEDGILGISDNHQRLCFALALWNGRDPILKERMFGLTGTEGNHGEDVKEYYFYLDSTPTHSYLKGLYKYPHAAFPYEQLIEVNKRRGRDQLEYELLDTGVFDENRYFDVLVEYAKDDPEDILVRLSVTNRGPDPAPLHLLPTLWFRNTWAFGETKGEKPSLRMISQPGDTESATLLRAEHPTLGHMLLAAEPPETVLFTDNETNYRRIFNTPDSTPFQKDGIERHSSSTARRARSTPSTPARRRRCITSARSRRGRLGWSSCGSSNPTPCGISTSRSTRSSTRFSPCAKRRRTSFTRPSRPTRWTATPPASSGRRSPGCSGTSNSTTTSSNAGSTATPASPAAATGAQGRARNHDWRHLFNDDVLSLPDTWEFPWFASWDLAFHTLPLALIDPEFAKRQLMLLTREWYMHPNGQLPAYEWAFGDVNPPVHAWGAWRVYTIERKAKGGAPDAGDRMFLERVFQKLLMNFTWWVNRKDETAATSSRAASSGWTTSACSTAASPCPRAGIWSSPTRRAGWRCTRSTCSKSRSNSRSTTRSTRTSPASSSSISFPSPTP